MNVKTDVSDIKSVEVKVNGQNLKTAIEEMTGLVALCNGNGAVEEVQGVNPSETGLVGNDQITVLPGGDSAGNSACE